jgi:endoglucanase
MQFRSTSFIIFLTRITLTVVFLAGCAAAPAAPTQTPTLPPSPTPSPIPTPEPPVDAFTMNKKLAHSVNLANALEAPNEGDWGLTLKEEYFQLVHDAGFTAVRVPISWKAHAETSAPYTVAPEFFNRIDWVVNEAFSHDLAIVLDFHNFDELMQDPAKNQDRYIAIWKQIAEHYQNYPNNLVFELLNEPNSQLSALVWNKMIDGVLPVIRASNPTRNIVIGPAEYNGWRALNDLKLPADDQHIIVTFHYYDPFQFTHQGAEWVADSAGWMGTVWKGSSPEKQSIEFDFNAVSQWAAKNNRPVFLGEFGAYSKADLASRALWTTFVAREAEKLGFSWSYWEFGAGFGVYDPNTRQWNEPLLQALIPKP